MEYIPEHCALELLAPLHPKTLESDKSAEMAVGFSLNEERLGKVGCEMMTTPGAA
jgi:hypothetical protein